MVLPPSGDKGQPFGFCSAACLYPFCIHFPGNVPSPHYHGENVGNIKLYRNPRDLRTGICIDGLMRKEMRGKEGDLRGMDKQEQNLRNMIVL